MAIFSCPECKGKVSDKANACPHCGCPTSALAPAPAQASSARPQANGWKTTPKSISISLSTLEWLDDHELWDEFASVGVRGRSGIVQLALEQFYAAHITRDEAGKYHFDGSATPRTSSFAGGSYAQDGGASLYH